MRVKKIITIGVCLLCISSVAVLSSCSSSDDDRAAETQEVNDEMLESAAPLETEQETDEAEASDSAGATELEESATEILDTSNDSASEIVLASATPDEPSEAASAAPPAATSEAASSEPPAATSVAASSEPPAATSEAASSAPPAESSAVEPSEPETTTATVTAEQAQVYIGRSVTELYNAIGRPNSSSYATSCLGDGDDGELYYDGFIVYTYREGDVETVQDVL